MEQTAYDMEENSGEGRENLLQRLTPREIEVLRLVAQAKTNKEIAWVLRISPNTVKAHVAAVMQKLHAASRTEAAITFLRSGTVK